MRVIAFVGPSGTGKSYRSVMVSQQYGADAIIDDGLPAHLPKKNRQKLRLLNTHFL